MSQVHEDLLDERRFQDRRDDLEFAATVRAMLHVDLELALEQRSPAQAHRAVVHTVRPAIGGWRELTGRLDLLLHNQRAPHGIGCQHTMESDQV